MGRLPQDNGQTRVEAVDCPMCYRKNTGLRILAHRYMYGDIVKAWQITIQHPHFRLQRKIVSLNRRHKLTSLRENVLYECLSRAVHKTIVKIQIQYSYLSPDLFLQ